MIITHKTAILLLQKGYYNKETTFFYNKNGDAMHHNWFLRRDYKNIHTLPPAIEQYEAQKWLREKHYLHIIITPHNGQYNYSIIDNSSATDNNDRLFKTYEKALEHALYQSLLFLQDKTIPKWITA